MIKLKSLIENDGSYLEKKKMPKEGETVYALLSMPTKIIKAKILRITNIDNKGLGNTYMDVQELGTNKTLHLSIDQIYDHKPKQTEIEDEYGKVKVWK